MVKTVCDEAHALGYTVAAHTESPAGVKVALENGVDSIEHGAKMDDERHPALQGAGSLSVHHHLPGTALCAV